MKRRRIVLIVAGLATSLVAAAACVGEDPAPAATPSSPDGSTPAADSGTANASDAGQDAGGDTDADAGPPPVTFHPLDAGWSFVSFPGANANLNGGGFDDHYVYLTPGPENSTATRLDTNKPFTSDALESVSLAGLSADAKGFAAVVGDGANVIYYLPNQTTTYAVYAKPLGVFVDAGAPWKTYVPELGTARTGYSGAALANGALYVAANPASGNAFFRRKVTKDDPFGTKISSWSEALGDDPDVAPAYKGAIYDGSRYVFFIPAPASPLDNGLVQRFDSQEPLFMAGDSSFDTTGLDPEAKGFSGATFDGRFIYLVPEKFGVAVRYDTTKDFFNAPGSSAWEYIDLHGKFPNLLAGFSGARFDGKYVYLVPSGLNRHVYRYDTARPFDAASSWESYNLELVHPDAKDYNGAAFDGRFIYLIPRQTSAPLLRFDARDIPWTRPANISGF